MANLAFTTRPGDGEGQFFQPPKSGNVKGRGKHATSGKFCLSILLCAAAFAESQTNVCEKEWAGNYQMQEFCLKEQLKGGEAMNAYMERYGMTTSDFTKHTIRGYVPALIMDGCLKQWHPDLKMTAFCIKEEEDAAIRLGKTGKPGTKNIEFLPGVDGDIAAIAAISNHLKRHKFGHMDEARAAASKGDKARTIIVECTDGEVDFRVEATCLLTREASELKSSP